MTRFRRFLPLLVATQILGCDAGDLDRSFGRNGYVSSGWGSGTRTISGNWDQARAMVIDPWGRILVAGGRYDDLATAVTGVFFLFPAGNRDR